MKKIITLLFCIGAVATSFAQYDHQQANDDRNYRTERKRTDQYANSSNGNRNYDRNEKRGIFNNRNNYSVRERNFQIEKINRDFDFQIRAIHNDRHLRRREKKAAIRNANIERSRRIQMVNERFNYNHHWNR